MGAWESKTDYILEVTDADRSAAEKIQHRSGQLMEIYRMLDGDRKEAALLLRTVAVLDNVLSQLMHGVPSNTRTAVTVPRGADEKSVERVMAVMKEAKAIVAGTGTPLASEVLRTVRFEVERPRDA